MGSQLLGRRGGGDDYPQRHRQRPATGAPRAHRLHAPPVPTPAAADDDLRLGHRCASVPAARGEPQARRRRPPAAPRAAATLEGPAGAELEPTSRAGARLPRRDCAACPSDSLCRHPAPRWRSSRAIPRDPGLEFNGGAAGDRKSRSCAGDADETRRRLAPRELQRRRSSKREQTFVLDKVKCHLRN